MGILYFEAVAAGRGPTDAPDDRRPGGSAARREFGPGRPHPDILAGAHRGGRRGMPVAAWSIRPGTHDAAPMRKMKGAAA